jgi:DNA-binding NtrC family response regulator
MNSYFKSIWFVDDDPDEHDFFENTIKEINPGVRISHFYNGDQLMRTLFHSTPDIVFLDIYMPADGISCLKKIRENKVFDKLPIIMYTGTGYFRNLAFCYGYGATLCVLKQDSPLKMKLQMLHLLQFDWSNFNEITAMHFHKNNYSPLISPNTDALGAFI